MLDPDALPPRSFRKRVAILDAALPVFLRAGFTDANLDEIAAAAGASKVTIYNHFGSKDGLFIALIHEQIAAAEHNSDLLIAALLDVTDADIEPRLRAFAREFVNTVVQPHLVALRRTLIGEAERFPELADAWYARGPESGFRMLADLFGKLAARGDVDVDDPDVAARQFTWLILSTPLNEAMFRPSRIFTPAELDAFADAGVTTFLNAHGRGSRSPAQA